MICIFEECCVLLWRLFIPYLINILKYGISPIKIKRQRTISRILSANRVTIYLIIALLQQFPQSTRKQRIGYPLLFNFAPDEACTAVPLPETRWALTPPFHPYRFTGGSFSVALSVACILQCQRPAVSRHHIRRSPDFPPYTTRRLPALYLTTLSIFAAIAFGFVIVG